MTDWFDEFTPSVAAEVMRASQDLRAAIAAALSPEGASATDDPSLVVRSPFTNEGDK